jgi:hypothetical protein
MQGIQEVFKFGKAQEDKYNRQEQDQRHNDFPHDRIIPDFIKTTLPHAQGQRKGLFLSYSSPGLLPAPTAQATHQHDVIE